MRILLLTSYFFPDEHIGSSRWNRLSKYFLNMGHEIYVVATDNGANYDVPQKFSHGIARVNSYSSMPDRFLNTASNLKKDISIEKKRQNYQVEDRKTFVSMYNKLVVAVGQLARFPHIQWWSSGEMVKAGMAFVKKNKIDIIIATHPFPGCLKAASVISERTQIPWIADMRDGWSSYYDLEYKSGSFFNKLIIQLEKKYLNRSSKVVGVNQKLVETLQVRPEKLVVVPNSFDSDELSGTDAYTKTYEPRRGQVNFAFAGTILPQHSWNVFLQGLAEFIKESADVTVLINYFGKSFDILLANGMENGIDSDIFVDHGYLSKKELKDQLQQADFLIVFGFNGRFGETVTTGKIFDYMEADKPVIVVGRTDSELASLVKKTGIGFVASSSADMKKILNDFATDPVGFVTKVRAGRNPAEIIQYSSRATAEAYIYIIEEITSKTKQDK